MIYNRFITREITSISCAYIIAVDRVFFSQVLCQFCGTVPVARGPVSGGGKHQTTP